MNKPRFVIIGDGQIARFHRAAIESVGGEIVYAYDPLNNHGQSPVEFAAILKRNIDFFVISSPTDTHYTFIKLILSEARSWTRIIVEKPMRLPWEPIIDDERINVVLQLRQLNIIPKQEISVNFVRDAAYFKTWKGDPMKTGGLFYNLFIHFIDLAHINGVDFVGMVSSDGEQWRRADDQSILLDHASNQACYNSMYNDIIAGHGINPSDLFYLYWIMDRFANKHGYGRDVMDNQIRIPREMM